MKAIRHRQGKSREAVSSLLTATTGEAAEFAIEILKDQPEIRFDRFLNELKDKMTDTGTRTQARFELDYLRYTADKDPIGWCRRIKSLVQRAYPTVKCEEILAGMIIRTFPPHLRKQFNANKLNDADPKQLPSLRV